MIVLNNHEHARLISECAGTVFNPACDTVISRVRGDKLLGGVTYTGYTGASIAMHVGAFTTDWLNKDMLWVCFDYPFNMLGVNKVIGQVPSYNTHALNFDLRLGFKQESIIRDVFPDGDLLVLGMYKDDCRWLKLKPSTLEASYGR